MGQTIRELKLKDFKSKWQSLEPEKREKIRELLETFAKWYAENRERMLANLERLGTGQAPEDAKDQTKGGI